MTSMHSNIFFQVSWIVASVSFTLIEIFNNNIVDFVSNILNIHNYITITKHIQNTLIPAYKTQIYIQTHLYMYKNVHIHSKYTNIHMQNAHIYISLPCIHAIPRIYTYTFVSLLMAL